MLNYCFKLSKAVAANARSETICVAGKIAFKIEASLGNLFGIIIESPGIIWTLPKNIFLLAFCINPLDLII